MLLLLRLHRAFTALLATHSKVESPSSLLRIPNSTSKDPAPAVHVSLWLSGGTPFFRFTCNRDRQAALSQLCSQLHPHHEERAFLVVFAQCGVWNVHRDTKPAHCCLESFPVEFLTFFQLCSIMLKVGKLHFSLILANTPCKLHLFLLSTKHSGFSFFVAPQFVLLEPRASSVDAPPLPHARQPEGKSQHPQLLYQALNRSENSHFYSLASLEEKQHCCLQKLRAARQVLIIILQFRIVAVVVTSFCLPTASA